MIIGSRGYFPGTPSESQNANRVARCPGAAFNMDEPYVVEPGSKLNLRYRLVLHRGNAVEGQMEQRFQEWAAKPEVKIRKVSKRQ